MGSAHARPARPHHLVWAEKFDHAAAVTNFVVAPLSLLSGTFYSIDALSPAFRAVSHANPFFYVISGFRYGFLGARRFAGAVRRVAAAGHQRRARRPVLRAAAVGVEAEALIRSDKSRQL